MQMGLPLAGIQLDPVFGNAFLILALVALIPN
jgi:hypothetical protein